MVPLTCVTINHLENPFLIIDGFDGSQTVNVLSNGDAEGEINCLFNQEQTALLPKIIGIMAKSTLFNRPLNISEKISFIQTIFRGLETILPFVKLNSVSLDTPLGNILIDTPKLSPFFSMQPPFIFPYKNMFHNEQEIFR